MARFRVYWTVAVLSTLGVAFTLLFNYSGPSPSETPLIPIESEIARSVESNLLEAYDSTIRKYGSTTSVLDPCSMSDSFGNMSGLSKCGNSVSGDD